MTSKRTHDLVANIGEYTSTTGETKKRRHNCGSVFLDEQGRMSIKLDAVPVSPEWSGWLSAYPVDNDKPDPDRRKEQRQATMPRAPPVDPNGHDEDDIPF